MHGDNSSAYADMVEINLRVHEVVVQIDRKESNIKIGFNSDVTSDEKKKIGFHYISVLYYYCIRLIYILGVS